MSIDRVGQVAVGGQDGEEIGDVVAAITQGRLIERQQPQAVDAEPFEVVELFDQAAEIAGTVAGTILEAADYHLIEDCSLEPTMIGRIDAKGTAHDSTNRGREGRAGGELEIGDFGSTATVQGSGGGGRYPGVRTRRALRRTCALSIAAAVVTFGGPVGSLFMINREVIDDSNAGDCSAIADVNGDGLPDVMNGGGLHREIVTLRAYLAPDFNAVELAQPSQNTAFVGDCQAADLDGDGDADLVITEAALSAAGLVHGPSSVIWLENTGSAAPAWPAHQVGVHPSGVPLDLAADDFNGDGLADVAARSDGALAIWLSGPTSQGQSGFSRLAPAVPAGRGLTAADVDHDGDVDLVAGGIVVENTGGDWTTQPINGSASATSSVGDVDGDGIAEVVLGPFDTSGPIVAYRSNGDGSWSAVPVASSTGGPIHHLALADLDHDADLDVISAVMFGNVTGYLNAGQARRWDPAVIDPDGLFDFAVGDLDGDGDNDLAGSNHAGNAPVVILRNLAADSPASGGPPEAVSVTGGPTPAPTTTMPPSTVPPTTSGLESTTSSTDITTGTADAASTATSNPADEVALGFPPVVPITAPSTSTGSTLRPGSTSTSAATVSTFGPANVDTEVAVLPQTLERTRGLDTTRLWWAVLAAIAACGAATLWFVRSSRTLAITGFLRHRHTAESAELTGTALSVGGASTDEPEPPTDPAEPTDEDPAN